MRRIFLSVGIFLATSTFAQQKQEKISVHGQMTVVNQYKPAFTAKYSGQNSLQPEKETQTSLTGTLYLGAKLWKGASFYFNPEIAGGSGLSGALGVAAAPNGETFRVGDPAPNIYLARVFLKQIFPLSNKKIFVETDQNQLGEMVPEKYFSITAGKVGIADFFDDNKYSHDARTQFMSWALMGNGAWDYPANTRGYTPSFVAEYVTPKNELRYAASLMPKTANGNDMNWEIGKSLSHTLEYTHKHSIKGKQGAVRVLGFYTYTRMGNYNEAVQLNPINADVESTRAYGRTKFGFGINIEQDLTQSLGCFARASWNDGKNETWAFTEIDKSMSVGFVMNGSKWKRANDNIGLAYVTSGISKEHRSYLKAGGSGFMLGDGNLNYSWEHLVELYYSAELIKGQMFLSGAYQMIVNPGYNVDRSGPVNVFSLRLHQRL